VLVKLLASKSLITRAAQLDNDQEILLQFYDKERRAKILKGKANG
jgi:hypothetical protein